MANIEFDRLLIESALTIVQKIGWNKLTVASAAHAAGLSLFQANKRFPSRASLLTKIGEMADYYCLNKLNLSSYTSAKECLFDILMLRIDFFQSYRASLLTVTREIITDPHSMVTVGRGSATSLRWIGQVCGLRTSTLKEPLVLNALMVVWAYTFFTWQKDSSTDLAKTMSALDRGLIKFATFVKKFLNLDINQPIHLIDSAAQS